MSLYTSRLQSISLFHFRHLHTLPFTSRIKILHYSVLVCLTVSCTAQHLSLFYYSIYRDTTPFTLHRARARARVCVCVCVLHGIGGASVLLCPWMSSSPPLVCVCVWVRVWCGGWVCMQAMVRTAMIMALVIILTIMTITMTWMDFLPHTPPVHK